MELWRSVRAEPSRPESEELAEACVASAKELAPLPPQCPPPSLDVLSAQLQSLLGAYRKLATVDGSDRVARGPPPLSSRRDVATTEPRRRMKAAATVSRRLLATTASAAARAKSRRIEATPAPPPPPETDVPKAQDDKDDDLHLSRPSRRALNPFPQLSPFLPVPRSPAKTPAPSAPTLATPRDRSAYRTATHCSRAKSRLLATTPAEPAPRHHEPARIFARTAPLDHPSPRPPAPPPPFQAQQPGNPYQHVLALGVSPPLDPKPPT